MFEYLESIPGSISDRYYTKLDEISLTQPTAGAHHSIISAKLNGNLKLDRFLVQLGQVPKIILPTISLDHQPNLVIDYSRIYPRTFTKSTSSSNKHCLIEKCRLEADTNLAKLASKYEANVAMTNAAFVQLISRFSTATDDDELKLPFSVRSMANPETGQTLRIVCVDKPFVAKHVSKREKNEKFFKRALMVSLVRQQPTVNTRTANNRRQASSTAETLLNEEACLNSRNVDSRQLEKLNVLDYDLISDVDSFGCGDKTEKKKEAVQPPQPTPTPVQLPKTSLTKPTLSSKQETTGSSSKRTRMSVASEEDEEEEEEQVENKKLKSTNSSDYEDYEENSDNGDDEEVEEEEEEKRLVISDETGQTRQKLLLEALIGKVNRIVKNDVSEPASPSSSSIQEPDEIVYDLQKPKVIPLDKVAADDKQPSPKKSATKTVFAACTSKQAEEKIGGDLNLFDFISKMQEKLIQTPSNVRPASSSHTHSARANLPSENAKDFAMVENVHGNVNYSTWSFENTEPRVQVLMRASSDGYINTESSSFNSVVLYPKLEYQPQFGCEKLTNKDYCRMWAKSYIRNNCDVILCRINVFTNKLISVTQLKHEEILSKDGDFNPTQALNQLRIFLQKALSLDEGNYLLNKEPNEAKLSIMKSTKNKSPFDLHFIYSGFSVDEQKLAKDSYWVPIDYEIYLPYHLKMNRVPGLFEPVFTNRRSGESGGRGGRSGGRGGGRGNWNKGGENKDLADNEAGASTARKRRNRNRKK